MSESGWKVGLNRHLADVSNGATDSSLEEFINAAEEVLQSQGLATTNNTSDLRAQLRLLVLQLIAADDAHEIVSDFICYAIPLFATNFEQQRGLEEHFSTSRAKEITRSIFGTLVQDQISKEAIEPIIEPPIEVDNPSKPDRRTPSLTRNLRREILQYLFRTFIETMRELWNNVFQPNKTAEEKLHLVRKRMSEAAEKLTLELPAVKTNTVSSLDRSSTKFALQRQFIASSIIDQRRSVEKSLKMGGFFTPVWRRRSIQSEYVVLSKQVSARDMEHQRIKLLAEELAHHGVVLHFYPYRNDPRELIDTYSEGFEKFCSIHEIISRHPEARLVIASEGREFLHPLTQAPYNWVHELNTWNRRALVTSLPSSDWGKVESVFHFGLGYSVSSSQENGLSNIGRILGGTQPIADRKTGSNKPPTPLFVASTRANLTLDVPPIEQEQIKLLDELKVHLGEVGFLWLGICAHFPYMPPAIVLFFGKALEEGGDYFSAELDTAFAKIAGLPWMRFGYMPRWVRELVFGDLSKEDQGLAKEIASSVFKNENLSSSDMSEQNIGLFGEGNDSIILPIRFDSTGEYSGIEIDELSLSTLGESGTILDPVSNLSVDDIKRALDGIRSFDDRLQNGAMDTGLGKNLSEYSPAQNLEPLFDQLSLSAHRLELSVLTCLGREPWRISKLLGNQLRTEAAELVTAGKWYRQAFEKVARRVGDESAISWFLHVGEANRILSGNLLQSWIAIPGNSDDSFNNMEQYKDHGQTIADCITRIVNLEKPIINGQWIFDGGVLKDQSKAWDKEGRSASLLLQPNELHAAREWISKREKSDLEVPPLVLKYFFASEQQHEIEDEIEERDVFIAYTHPDLDIARDISELLTESEISSWWDQSIPLGEKWQSNIRSKLQSAKLVIFVMSDGSGTSEAIRVEAQLAKDLGKPVLPIHVRGNEIDIDWPPYILEWDTIHLTNRNIREASSRLTAKIRQLLLGNTESSIEQRLRRFAPYVYVSCASEDNESVKPLLDALMSANIRVFFPSPGRAGYPVGENSEAMLGVEAGEPWDVQIDQALSNAACRLFVVSAAGESAFNESQEIRREVQLAQFLSNRDPKFVQNIFVQLDSFNPQLLVQNEHQVLDGRNLESVVQTVREEVSRVRTASVQEEMNAQGQDTGRVERAPWKAIVPLCGRAKEVSEFRRLIAKTKPGSLTCIVIVGSNRSNISNLSKALPVVAKDVPNSQFKLAFASNLVVPIPLPKRPIRKSVHSKAKVRVFERQLANRLGLYGSSRRELDFTRLHQEMRFLVSHQPVELKRYGFDSNAEWGLRDWLETVAMSEGLKQFCPVAIIQMEINTSDPNWKRSRRGKNFLKHIHRIVDKTYDNLREHFSVSIWTPSDFVIEADILRWLDSDHLRALTSHLSNVERERLREILLDQAFSRGRIEGTPIHEFEYAVDDVFTHYGVS